MTMNDERSPIEIVADYLNRVPVDVDTMASALGLPIAVDHAMPDAVSGKLERVRGTANSFRIVVNGRHHKNRQRFTIAHEIAHYVLHREMIGESVTDDALYRSAQLSNATETQANRYAASLLMPAEQVRLKYQSGVRSYAEMARVFGVSSEVARIRMKELFGA